jgi:hypothetical protein
MLSQSLLRRGIYQIICLEAPYLQGEALEKRLPALIEEYRQAKPRWWNNLISFSSHSRLRIRLSRLKFFALSSISFRMVRLYVF